MRALPSSARQASGASLVVVLILLLVMTLLGLAVLRGTLLEERMSANLLDRSQNFQAAEAALREAEGMIAGGVVWGVNPPAAGSGCTNGMCGSPAAGSADRATSTTFAGWRNAVANVNNGIAGAQAVQPQFFVEHAGWSETWFECNLDVKYRGTDLCIRPAYRVTSRSEADGRASVILQSNFIAP